MKVKKLIREFRLDDGGATAIEYGLICGIIATVVIGIFASGAALSSLYQVIEAVVTALA